MIGSDFKSGVKILFETRVLRGASASEPYSAGWRSIQTETADVIDLNGNGKADCKLQEGSRGRGDGAVTLTITEPALHFPTMQQLTDFTRQQGKSVVTQDELPQVFVEEMGAHIPNGDDSEKIRTSNQVRPLSLVVAKHLGSIQPQARFAFDVDNDTFFIYMPKPHQHEATEGEYLC